MNSGRAEPRANSSGRGSIVGWSPARLGATHRPVARRLLVASVLRATPLERPLTHVAYCSDVAF